MKSIIILILLFPVLIFGQDIAKETGSSEDNLYTQGVTFTNLDGKLSPNTKHLTSRSGSSIMMDNLDKLIIEVDPSVGLAGPAFGQGINNGIFVLSMSHGMSSAVSVGSGMPISSAGTNPQAVSLVRYVNVNSAKIRSLMILGTVIPYIELHYLKLYSGAFKIYQTIRYEDCLINSYSGGGTGGEDNVTESFSFIFTKACYKSLELDVNGNQVSQNIACLDRTLSDQSGCACGPF